MRFNESCSRLGQEFQAGLESVKTDADRVRVTTNHLLQVAILDLF